MPTEPTTENLVFDGCSGTIDVEWLDGNRYRILGPEVAIFTEDYSCGDIVEADRNGDNALVVKRCLERGNYRTLEYVLAPGWHEKQTIKQVLDEVQRLGGRWVGIFGGVLVVALPPDADYDPTQDINDAMTGPV